MSEAIHLRLLGGFGNRCFQWAHGKAFAEQNGYELRTEPWVGEQIFTLDGHDCARPDGTELISLSGYFQSQDALIYTLRDARRWFRLKPEIEEKLAREHIPDRILAHIRRGDFKGHRYPLISVYSYIRAAEARGFDASTMAFVSDAYPDSHPDFTGELSFLPDWHRMLCAQHLFRANSSFSWWAATLGTGKVYSPLVTGLIGGEENHCHFADGNHPRLAELAFVTDLFLPE